MRRFALLLLVPALAQAQTYTGELRSGDSVRNTGQLVDLYEVTVTQGQTITAEVTSLDFDPYLAISGTRGEEVTNDDCTSGDLTRSCASLVASSNGIVTVIVSSFRTGGTGRYRAQIDVLGSPRPSTSGGILSGLRTGPQNQYREAEIRGELRPGDPVFRDGEYADTYTVDVRSGDRVTIGLYGDDFDTYLLAVSPSGIEERNDDCTLFDTDNSCLDFTAREGGTWRVSVTSLAAGETGAYRVAAAANAQAVRLRPAP